jgi:hypothetical protein
MFLFWRIRSLYNSGVAVWREQERPAFWKAASGVTIALATTTHQNRATNLYPRYRQRGVSRGLSNVLTNGVRMGRICAFCFVHTLMRLVWESNVSMSYTYHLLSSVRVGWCMSIRSNATLPNISTLHLGTHTFNDVCWSTYTLPALSSICLHKSYTKMHANLGSLWSVSAISTSHE